jgi:hypothetical protein
MMTCVVVCSPVGLEVIDELDREVASEDAPGVSISAVGRIELPVSVLTNEGGKSVEAAGSSGADVGGGRTVSEADPGAAERISSHCAGERVYLPGSVLSELGGTTAGVPVEVS